MKFAPFIVALCSLTASFVTASWLAAAGLAQPARAAGGGPAVVVTLKPVHSLVAGVMAGVGEPRLLIAGAASPHAYSLRPSDARALSEADLVFWVGPGMETFLARPMASLASGAEVVTLSRAAGVRLLENRASGAWEAHGGHEHEPHAGHEEAPDEAQDEAHEDAHEEGHGPDLDAYNLHIWLDPDNAAAIVEAAVAALSRADPAHAADYRRNGEALRDRLTALDRELASVLAPVRERPFVVFHDAYPYFEDHFGLNAVGAITLSPDRAPGAQRLSEIRDKIAELNAACVFSEPQFTPSVVRAVVGGTSARQGVLDPLGVDLAAGPEAYFALMRDLAGSLERCLDVAS